MPNPNQSTAPLEAQLPLLLEAIVARLDALADNHARLSCALDFGDLVTISRIEDNAEALLELARQARILLSPAGVADGAKQALYALPAERMIPGGDFATVKALRAMGSEVAA